MADTTVLMHESGRPVAGRFGRSLRVSLWCGIAYAVTQLGAVVYFTGTVLSAKPAAGAPPSEHATFYVQQAERLLFGNWLLTLPVPFFLVFLGGLYIVLRRAEGTGALSVAALTSGATLAMIWPLGALLSNLGVTLAQSSGDAATVWALDSAGPLTLALSALPRSAFLAAASIVLLRGRVVANWIPVLGLTLAPLLLVGSATPMLPALFPFAAFGSALAVVWTLALSIALLRAGRGP